MTIVLFDTPQTHQAFYPLTLTKPVAGLRQGILTMQERWRLAVAAVPVRADTNRGDGVSGSWSHEPGQEEPAQEGLDVSGLWRHGPWQEEGFGISEDSLNLSPPTDHKSYLYIDATLLSASFSISNLPTGTGLLHRGRLVAVKTTRLIAYPVQQNLPENIQLQEIEEAHFLQAPWQLFQTNGQAIAADFQLLTAGRTSQPIDATTVVTGGTAIFIEEGAVVKGCFLNASEGPIYIGKNALVMEGTTIRGPVAICANAVVKMGARLYGGTTVGPHCTAGGEIKNAILSGYSNKAHDGYLGDAVIGEWCNLGAGTTNSNVKNTAGTVTMWSEAAGDFVPIGKKAGLLMGDYSRSAINTGFNTGTVVGACCNVFGAGQPPKHVSSFTWGEEKYRPDKALIDISNWKAFKGRQLEEREKQMLNELYRSTLPAAEI